MRMTHKSSLCDAFIVMGAPSTVRVKAIVDSIEEMMDKKHTNPRVIDGYADGLWVILDYFDVVVHVFHEQMRRFYNLETLWGDVPQNKYIKTTP